FFFQAEDGIRDGHVTGVQTCALPISGAVYDGGECYDRAGSDDEDCSVERKVCGRTGFAGGNLLRREPARRRSGTAAAKGFDDGKIGRASCRERVKNYVGGE